MAKKEILFSESIITDRLADNNLNDELVEILKDHEKQNHNIIKSNIGGFQTPLIKNKKIENIFLLKSFEVLSKFYDLRNTKLIMEGLWINRNYKNNINIPHIHPHCVFSGIYYIKTPKEGGVLKFLRNDKSVESLPSHPIQDTDFFSSYDVQPQDNGFILFPSYMSHMVLSHSENESRISLSFNILIKHNG